ncbi:helix-turn-helix transcriptional regulator [Saccharothrix longispora]|uniref:helix-turn-helix domain-containing protein n=1 Tax=Saccharothrix longispora TaxID=33920 RepID=UPI0028FD3230|nr:helix-turn-helix transcriptional regulator [Saccharothrix longispora]MDU0289713.1 helix-turn-helix transcriptional regulator [Saccharothrix longispora]
MDQHDLGDRIRRLRGHLMTQRELSEAAGVSLSLVRALEQRQRHTASIASLHKIARALDTDIGVLLGKRTNFPGDDTGVHAIRHALMPVDDLLDEASRDGEPVDVDQARRAVDFGWGSYWSGSYNRLSALLPVTLAQLRVTVRSTPEDHTTHELLARGYWLTACTLVHLGHQDAAWLAIRQALDAASRGGDPLLDAVLRGSASWQLLVQGRYDEAAQVALRSASNVHPAGDVPPAHLSVYGSLLITAATATGRDGDLAQAAGLLSEAEATARRNGVDRTDYESPFGPAQVIMQTVDVHVVAERYEQAIKVARTMPRDAALPLAARARHLTDTAFAYVHLDDTRRARDALLTVERMAPDWIRHQSLPKQVASELVRRDRDNTTRRLAKRLGVTGGE